MIRSRETRWRLRFSCSDAAERSAGPYRAGSETQGRSGNSARAVSPGATGPPAVMMPKTPHLNFGAPAAFRIISFLSVRPKTY